MGLTLNTNPPSLVAQRNLNKNIQKVNSSFEKLASGLRINRASDDAAGLNISEALKTQINGNQKAIANAQDGTNLLQIAEGSLSVIGENLQRIRELTVQAANDTNSTAEREAIALEVQARMEDVNRIALSTKSNNINLLNGDANTFALQIGANSEATTNVLTIGTVLENSTCAELGLSAAARLSIATAGAGGIFEDGDSCRTFLDAIDTALDNVFSRRSSIGALQNRLDSTIESLSISVENLQSTNSRIRDLDIASETTKMTQNQILQQAAVSVLAQANQTPSLALGLMG